MQYRPLRTTGIALGTFATAWALIFAALLLLRAATQPVSLSTVFCYLFAVVFFAIAALGAYWTYGCATLSYTLDRNGLSIHWGFVRQVIPIDSIKRLARGEVIALGNISGVNWPGYHVGRADIREVGETLFYSTHRGLSDLVYVVTPSLTYAVSPADVQQFITDVESVQKQGATVPLLQVPRRERLIDQPFWHDRWAQGLAAAAVLLCATTFGVIFANYAGLPQNMAISFPPLEVERVASKHELLSLPTTAFAVLLVSLIAGFAVRSWERLASYMVLASLVAVQGVFLWGAAVAVS
jgi:Bacterial PH domain